MTLAEEIRLAAKRPAGVISLAAAVAAIAILIAGVGALFGSWLSTREPGGAWPPLAVELESFETNGEMVQFRLIGRKLTAQSLIGQTAAWVYSAGYIEPAAIYRFDGQVTPGAAVLHEGEEFRTGLLRVEVPAAVFSDQGARFRLCWAFEDQGTWCGVDVLFLSIPRAAGDVLFDDEPPGAPFRAPSIDPIRN